METMPAVFGNERSVFVSHGASFGREAPWSSN
jgi:hypothetical protein